MNPERETRNSVTITLWGSGSPYREFLYVDDLADACVFVVNNVDFSDLATNIETHNPDSDVSADSSVLCALCPVPPAPRSLPLKIPTSTSAPVKILP
jgi:hypothetical protein